MFLFSWMQAEKFEDGYPISFLGASLGINDVRTVLGLAMSQRLYS